MSDDSGKKSVLLAIWNSFSGKKINTQLDKSEIRTRIGFPNTISSKVGNPVFHRGQLGNMAERDKP